MKALNNFFDMLNNDESRTLYGLQHMEDAIEKCAVDVLLVSDSLFRSNDIQTRIKYSGFVDNVKRNGGKVYIFSSMHVTGDQLSKLGGIAAILKFPLYFEESGDVDDDEDSTKADS